MSGLAVLVLPWVGGCAVTRADHLARRKPPRGPQDSVRVVHVVSERHFLAGFPLGGYRYATAARELEPLRMAVVDGFPMVATGTEQQDHGAADVRPYIYLFGRGLQMTPNRNGGDLDFACGDAVLVGGFALPRDPLTPQEYWDVPVSIIKGRVFALPQAGHDALTWVLVPAANYAGFVGGPAATQNAKGDVRVWGIVTHSADFNQRWWPFGLLGVAKLPDGAWTKAPAKQP